MAGLKAPDLVSEAGNDALECATNPLFQPGASTMNIFEKI